MDLLMHDICDTAQVSPQYNIKKEDCTVLSLIHVVVYILNLVDLHITLSDHALLFLRSLKIKSALLMVN